MPDCRLDEILKKLTTEHISEKPLTIEEWQQLKIDNFNDSRGFQNEIDGYDCEICKNKEFIARLDENGNEVHSFCKCHRIRETLRRAQRSGLGNILTDFTFDKFKASEGWQKSNKSKAMEFCKDKDAHWFFIGGQVGSGKTHLCTAICAYYIKAGYDVQYMLWVEESKKLKALVNQNSEYQNIIEKYKRADVLYIDDFLKTKANEAPTNGDINLAFEIINNRYLNTNKITIISCERVLNDLLRFDEATASRIYEAVGKYNIEIGKDEGKNHRIYPNRPVGA